MKRNFFRSFLASMFKKETYELKRIYGACWDILGDKDIELAPKDRAMIKTSINVCIFVLAKRGIILEKYTPLISSTTALLCASHSK